MGGHVFIIHSDLTKLKCDVWLLPGDRFLSVGGAWATHLSRPVRDRLNMLRRDRTRLPTGWDDNGTRVLPLTAWDEHSGEPEPYLVNVGGDPATPVGWFLEGVRQLFETVAEHAASRRIRPGRGAKVLVGLPVIGTGRGGASGAKGSLVRAVVDAVHEEAERRDLDVVLVTKDRPMFVAAQNARRQCLWERFGEASGHWPDLPPGLTDEARRLATYAVTGRLVLFIGAGVNRTAGLPSWRELIERLAVEARMDPAELEALARLHELDRARIVQHRLAAQGSAIGDVIASLLAEPRFSLAHALLASLPVGEAVTTNYDCLFEAASAAAGREAAVLPYQTVVGRSRWLLKLHGCITHPSDIVLTREDYLRYADRRAALAAIVQAMLITRHMLFVGFSLTDDNFHRIIDDVRKVVRGANADPDESAVLGSVLQLGRDDLWEELWKRDLDIVSLAGQDGHDRDVAERRLEIFLDLLLSEASRESSPLLDPAFDGVLTDEERVIRGLLNELVAKASTLTRDSPAWGPIAVLLQALGAPAAARIRDEA